MIRALVTRWRRVGAFGRTGPMACEVQAGRTSGKLVLRIEQGDNNMFVLAEREDAERLAWQIIKECRKLPR